MPLGIRLTVDFPFKKTFGTPENAISLIGLLNAILNLERPIVSVSILNPFSYQEFEGDKQITLDIRCRDEGGRWLNVEMQVEVRPNLLQRLTYYAGSLYVDQLQAGQDYSSLTTAISICLLDQRLFRDSSQAHHRFQLVDIASQRQIPDALEVHTLELTKYDISVETITTQSALHQWVFLLQKAHEYDAATLKRLLPGVEFHLAIDTLAAISAKSEDRLMYDQRERARRDYEWAIRSAQREGRAEGREEGRAEGLDEGLEKGRLAGIVQTLQEVLGEPIVPLADLQEQSLESLNAQASQLRQRLAQRSS